jgi:hypothetical protein
MHRCPPRRFYFWSVAAVLPSTVPSN